MSFFKITISHILKRLKVRNAILFFLGIRYMLLANKRTGRKKARSLFFKLKSILLENIKAKKSFKSRIKSATQCNYRNKTLIILKEILHRNLYLIKKHMSPCSFFFFVLFSFFTSEIKTGMECHTCFIV